jgi:hypothetical protein
MAKKTYWELSQFCVFFCSFNKLTGWVGVFICQKQRKRPIFDEIRATNRNKKSRLKIGIKMRKPLNDNSIKAKKGLAGTCRHRMARRPRLFNIAFMAWPAAATNA